MIERRVDEPGHPAGSLHVAANGMENGGCPWLFVLHAVQNPDESDYDEDELMIGPDFDPEAFSTDEANARLQYLRGVTKRK